MSNIIEFPGFKTEQSLYPDWLKEALDTLPQNMRDEIRKAMEEPVKKYGNELFEKVHISLPKETTEEQRESVKGVIVKQRENIRELVTALAVANAELVLNKYKNS